MTKAYFDSIVFAANSVGAIILVSYFLSVKGKAVTMALSEILERIRNGYYAKIVNDLMEKLAPHVPFSDKWNEAKSKWKQEQKDLPCVTMNCVIKEGLTRSDANIDYMNGIICLDFDGKDQPDLERFSHFKEYAREKAFTVASGDSISKSGDFLLALTDCTDKALFKQYFNALKDEFAKDGFIADNNASSLSNFRFISDDPDLYINPDAVPFTLETTQTCQTPLCKFEEKKAYEKPEIEVRTLAEEYERIEQILRENPNSGIADSYYDWFQVGLAFVDTFGEKGRPLFHQYSALSAKYNPSQCDRKYTSLLRSSRGCHTLATFYHICEQHGVNCSPTARL